MYPYLSSGKGLAYIRALLQKKANAADAIKVFPNH